MGQQVASQVVPPQGVTAYINGLANQNDDVLWVLQQQNGEVLIIFKNQTVKPPTSPIIPQYGTGNPIIE